MIDSLAHFESESQRIQFKTPKLHGERKFIDRKIERLKVVIVMISSLQLIATA
jgi:hypothetical protein